MKKQISDRKRQANRTNSERSTGPRTPEGKARSRYNALTHGLTAKVLLTRGEDDAEFREYFRRVREDLRPKGFIEEIRVEDAVAASWRLRRVALYESAWVAKQMRHAESAMDRNAAALPEKETFHLVSRYDTKHRRDRDRALRELERLQDRRRRETRERRRLALQQTVAEPARADGTRLRPHPDPDKVVDQTA